MVSKVVYLLYNIKLEGTRWSACTSDIGVSTAHSLSTASVNETIVKPRVAAEVGRKTMLKPFLAAATNMYMSDFPDVKFRVAWLIR